jgi:hypothetical protein
LGGLGWLNETFKRKTKNKRKTKIII